MLILLVLLIAVVVIAVFIWNYRRQAAAREAASAERMKAFLDAARATAPPGQAPAPPGAPAVQPAAAVARPRPDVSGFSARVPFMNAEQAACHAALKGALPEHEVFARVTLAAFIKPADNLTGFAREAQERRLADTPVDFLVCDKTLNAIAAVQCGTKNGKAADTAAFAAACVESTGLRWVEIAPLAPAQRDEVRQRILGR